ncbi:hypothetical protein PsorP6_009654 [Peronosclerospora sorghi]|uniref:Uncharacterized protein n=1 Tax=Peronosclerospora sorghi TaxID=230839 RepID=A0ACC0VZ20_9STRA|nr:hypothetical protein PsorP6_009654 [Peronosclerospora sorghi]
MEESRSTDNMDADTNVKVFCRVRPPNERECGVESSNLTGSTGFLSRSHAASASASYVKKCVTVPGHEPSLQTVLLHTKHGSTKTFTFDRVFGEDASQNDVFDVVGAPITRACLEGYNGTIFAYGQTGSGKTYTMQGPDDVIDTEARRLTDQQLALRGLVPRVFDYLFENVRATDPTKHVEHTFTCSFLEIYNERVYDLLDGSAGKDAAGLQLRENGRKGVHVEGLIESVVTNPKKAAELMTVGAQNRRVGQTSMNRESSRSHSVFILQLQSKEMSRDGTKIRTSRFNLVDLAGSERQRSTDAAGERLKEAGNINRSLSALGNVILGLSEQSVGKHRHVHYRDSKLTFLLKDSLGGNSKTFMIATISPAEDSAFETLSTLKFAQRAKMIQNSAVINEDSVGSAHFLQEEIQRLRRQLQQAHQEIARAIPGSTLLLQQQDTIMPKVASSHDRRLEFGDPTIDTRFRELEESLAATAEKNDTLQRSCEYLELQNGEYQALCSELKHNVAHLKMMLRLRGIGGSDVHDYKPSADAIEWRMKYEEMNEQLLELQDEMKHYGIENGDASGTVSSKVEYLNLMLLTLSKQLAFVLRDKHDLQDQLVEKQAENESSTQEIVDAALSTRLEEALKQQAIEFQAKLDIAASISASLEEKAAETSMELTQMKKLEASWSIQQRDLERQLADSRTALQKSENSQTLTEAMLVQEKAKAKERESELERARESAQLEFQAALADVMTTNRSLEHSKKVLMQQLTTTATDLKQRELDVQKADIASTQQVEEMKRVEETNQRVMVELDETRGVLNKASLETASLRTEIANCMNVIDELKCSNGALTEEKRILQQQLEEINIVVRRLQLDADLTAQHHAKEMQSWKNQAQEEKKMLVEDYSEKCRLKDDEFQHLYEDFERNKVLAEEASRLHSLMMQRKDVSLSEMQQQNEKQAQKFQQMLDDMQQNMSRTLADNSRLKTEREKIEREFTSALQEIESLQNVATGLQTERDAMASEIETLSQRLEETLLKKSDVEAQNAELHESCKRQQSNFAELNDTVEMYRQQVEDLKQQIVFQSNEVTTLRKDLKSAQEESQEAAVKCSQRSHELALKVKTIEELHQELAESNALATNMIDALEKASSEIHNTEAAESHVGEEINTLNNIDATLRVKLEKLKSVRFRLVDALKTEQISKQDVESQRNVGKSVSALGKRMDDFILNTRTLLTLRLHREQENSLLKTLVAEQDRNIQELDNCVADKEDKIRVFESKSADLEAVQKELDHTIAKLQKSVHDLECQVLEQQSTLSKQEAVLATKTGEILEKDKTIAALKDCEHKNEAAWELKTREYKAELEAAQGSLQAFEQLVAEKNAVFAETEAMLTTEKESLEKLLAQQTEQLTLKVMEHEKVVEEKEKELELVSASLSKLKEEITQNDNRLKLESLEAAYANLEAKHKLVVEENASIKKEAAVQLKEKEDELNCRLEELDVAEEKIKVAQEALIAEKAAAECALKEARAKEVTQEVFEQAKRQFLADKVKLQREIQMFTSKIETLSKENAKLVGHHNSRQKIQHHVKVKEENNRLLDQVRVLTEEKLKLQRSLKKLQATLKEKENISVSTGNALSSLSPVSNATSCGPLATQKVSGPSLPSSKTAAASTAREEAAPDRSQSPGLKKKRGRTESSWSGPGWQR